MISKDGRNDFFVGFGIFAFFLLIGLAAPLIAPFDPYQGSTDPFGRPNRTHWLGGNDMGQDIFSELLYGGRISLFIGLSAALLSTATALVLALISGFKGGFRDRIIMRIVDVTMCLPFLPFVIVIGAFIGPGIGTQILVITLVMWAGPCRELRSQVLKVKYSEYIEAAMAMGGSSASVIRRHILPELVPLVIPQFIRAARKAIMMESTLSFLGLGDPILKSWGSILYFANSRTAFLTGAWVNWVLPPGLCITLVVLSLTFMGVAVGSNAGGAVYRPWGSFLRPRSNPRRKDSRIKGKSDGNTLRVDNLSVAYSRSGEEIHALSRVCFHIHPQSCTGIVGESGCGKSTLVMTIMGLLKFPAEVKEGRVLYGHSNLLFLEDDDMTRIRGRKIAYIPQNAMNALNPVKSLEEQLIEAVMLQQKIPLSQAKVKALELLDLVGIDRSRGRAYSHQLSGGMRQRVVIALALVNEPAILLADEATTGLDVLIQHGIISLLLELKERLGLTIFFITHDLPLIASIADHLIVIKDGEIIEEGPTIQVCSMPKHPYTRRLIDNFPRLKAPKIWRSDCRIDSSCEEILGVENLTKSFSTGSVFSRSSDLPVLKGLTFSLRQGEVLGLIGSSGSGKTTLARIIMNLHHPDGGRIRLNGRDLTTMDAASRRACIAETCHYVFQDPYQSLHGCKSILDIVSEPLMIRGTAPREIFERARRALKEVNLPWDTRFLEATPRELSGGQRQRIAFARAIVGNPKLIIADEPTSMLDVSLRMDLLELMETLRLRHRTSYLFITHDLALARHFCDTVLVLKEGRIVECGHVDEVIGIPKHPYTVSLLDAVREPDYLEV